MTIKSMNMRMNKQTGKLVDKGINKLVLIN